jgi:hypothetical protein
MAYSGKTIDKTADVSLTPNVNFSTVSALVQLQDIQGNRLSGGVVTYAAGSWLSFGTTDSNGQTNKELLPLSYTFRMKYKNTTKDQTQDISSNPTVIFSW